jgi:glycosyltransferase involved in cell wall biosynthesis
VKVLFLPLYSRLGGSSRYMVYDYLEFFRGAGVEAVVAPLFDEPYHQGIGNFARATSLTDIFRHWPYYMSRVTERMRWIRQSDRFDIVVLEKELLPYFPYGAEKLLKTRRAKLVTLFDDAVYAYYASHPNRLVRLLSYRKIERIINLSDHIIVWNAHLGEYARQLNPHVTVVNTGVDLRRYRLKDYTTSQGRDRVVIGWIGTPGSYPYIQELEDVFRGLAARYPVELRIVSSVDYVSQNIRVDNRRWSIETEVDDLCSFDIGIMPLPNNEWTKGKSGCKAVQYLAVGVPAICSPVGVTSEIVRDGVNGFLVDTPEAWFEKLAALIENPELRQQQGLAGQKLVENSYSIQSVAPRLIETLQTVERCDRS